MITPPIFKAITIIIKGTNMTLKECIDNWVTGKHEYIKYRNYKFYINVYGFLEEYGTDIEHPISNTEWLTSNEWELVEIKEKLPEGFYKNYFGEYIKPCKAEVWVNIYYNKEDNKEVSISYSTKKDAEFYSQFTIIDNRKYIFVKTIYLSQQYSIPYNKIKES